MQASTVSLAFSVLESGMSHSRRNPAPVLTTSRKPVFGAAVCCPTEETETSNRHKSKRFTFFIAPRIIRGFSRAFSLCGPSFSGAIHDQRFLDRPVMPRYASRLILAYVLWTLVSRLLIHD